MSPALVTAGALLLCPFGAAPCTLGVLPVSRVLVEGRPVAVITDILPAMNLVTFGMCVSLANPAVVAATAAALGVLTPMPCVPVPAGPWLSPAMRTQVGGRPVVTQGSMCLCAYGGAITVQVPGSIRSNAN